MKLNIAITFTLTCILCLCGSLIADWMRMDPPPDVDKKTHGHEGTKTCWLAGAANMLAGAGYGDGATVQERADAIYLQMVDRFGTSHGGWIRKALKWWLRSEHNKQYSNYDIKSYGFRIVDLFGALPWQRTDAPELIGNALRDNKLVGLSIRWPTNGVGLGTGGHVITCWGDTGTGDFLTEPPIGIFICDSDSEGYGGDVLRCNYDDYSFPNWGGPDEGKGWYLNYVTSEHPYLIGATTLTPLPSSSSSAPFMLHATRISCKIHQEQTAPATDLHYYVTTDQELVAYHTTVDWSDAMGPVITEIGSPRSSIEVDWDLSENPVPQGTWVTVTTDIVKPIGSSVEYDKLHFTYPADGFFIPTVSLSITSPPVVNPDEIPNILGGYIVMTFDLIDPAGSKVVAEYRVAHEYDYTENPEEHEIMISGPAEYSVGNIKIGHSYGLPVDKELWEFNEWKTRLAGIYSLDSADFHLDWNGMLPYPDPELVDVIPETAKCTYYYDEDLNKDCKVDLLDFQMLAAKWLMTTTN